MLLEWQAYLFCNVKMYFYKTPTFLFASHNKTWTKNQCHLKLRGLIKANTLHWNVSLFGISLDHTSLCNYICSLCELLK